MSEKNYPQRRTLNSSLCSCKACDSVVCFKKRRQSADNCTCEKCDSAVCLRKKSPGQCSCDKCVESKTCFFYTNQIVDLQESKSDVLKVQPRNVVESNKIAEKKKPKYVKELYEKETIYDNHNNTKVMVQKRSKYSYVEPVSHVQLSNKLENIAEKLCCEMPCSAVPETKTENLNKTEIACCKATKIITSNIESAQQDTTAFIETDDNSREKEKLNEIERSNTLDTENPNKIEDNLNRPFTIVNTALNYSETDIDSIVAKLSAKIMDVPYNGFKNTVSSNMPDNLVKPTELTKLNIINRIKEAYKACSCKVCECIANIPCQLTETLDDMCKCKPCDCDDCRKINKNVIKGKHSLTKYLNSANLCVCEPCNCLDCEMMANNNRFITVAPMSEEIQRPVCQCTPCSCLECGNVFGTIATTLTHEISTGVNRHRNCRCDACLNEACDQDITDSCRCQERDKVMRKPVQRDTNDYDIRSAIVSNKNPSTQGESSKSARNNTIAMFATLTNNYRRPARCDNDIYSSVVFKRLERKNNESISQPLKQSQNVGVMKKVSKSSNILNDCSCAPCECQICELNKTCYVEPNKRKNKCRYKVCDCNDCTNTINLCNEVLVTNRSRDTFTTQGICDCLPCECKDCQKNMHKYKEDICNKQIDDFHNETEHWTKKEDLLKVSMTNKIELENNINRTSLSNCDQSKNSSGKKSIHSHILKSSEPEMVIYQTYPSYIDNSIRNAGKRELLDHFDSQHRHTISNTKSKCYKSYTCSEFKEHGEAINFKNYLENMNRQVSETYISAVSSCATTSYFVHDSGSISPISRKRTTRSSWQSSLNSSGHDHSDYLIKFPRTPAETCINDIMKLNLDRKFNLNRMNILSKANADNDTRRTFLNDQNENYPCFPKQYVEENCGFSCEICKKLHLLKSGYCGSSHHCDGCLFSKLKIKTCKCNCIACNCYGACLRKDQLICIRMNEGTQTPLKLFQDRGQNSLGFENLGKNLFETNLVPYFRDDEMLRDTDCLCFDKHINVSNTYCPYNYICRSQDLYNIDFLSIPIHINYECLKNTLSEARAFSLELLETLEKYDRANIEFESVSEKLINLHESHSKNISSFLENKNDTQTNVSNADKNEKQSNVYENEEQLHRLIQNMELYKKEQHYYPVNNKEIEASKEIDARNLLGSISPKQMMDIESFSLYIFDEVCKQLFKKQQEVKSRNDYKKYRKLINRALSTARRFSADNKTNMIPFGTTTAENESTQVEVKEQKVAIPAQVIEDHIPIHVRRSSAERNELIENDAELKAVLGTTTLKTLESLRRSEVQATEKCEKLDDNRIFVDNGKSNEVQTKLDLELKDASNVSLSRTISIRKGSGNMEVADLQEAHLLLTTKQHHQPKDSTNYPSLNILVKKSQANSTNIVNVKKYNLHSIASAKNSCDAMKLNFTGVNRVSDHTILVKWNPPRSTKDIRGYELLVDGRAVQKVLSPTRCMAVVTCLPQADKVLLTIRVITIGGSSDRYLPSTIVYRPRPRAK